MFISAGEDELCWKTLECHLYEWVAYNLDWLACGISIKQICKCCNTGIALCVSVQHCVQPCIYSGKSEDIF